MSSPSSHPLLRLVDANKNSLKCALVKYIDVTVENQFGQLRNRIEEMIESGEIVLGNINACNQQSTPNTLPSSSSLVSTVTTSRLIKQEFLGTSSSTINVDRNDAPNEEDDYNDYDDDDSEDEGELIFDYAECEDCIKGICGLDGENGDNADNRVSKKVDTEIGLRQGAQGNGSVASGNLTVIPEVNNISNQSITDNTNVIEDNDQSNGQVKSDKRKSKTDQSTSKAVKKVKPQNVQEIHLKEVEEEAKPKIVTLELHCTEPDCKTTLNSHEMWKKHLSSIHGQTAYKQLEDNVRHNQHGQAEYRCTDCEVVSKSRQSLYIHWRNYHQAGKFECSDCAFVANFRCEVLSHHQKYHRSSKYQCTHAACGQVCRNKYDLAIHQRIHSGERPFVCIWDQCQSTFNQQQNAILHVRMRHFRLPRTVREQNEMNLIEERDPRDYIRVTRG